MAYPLQGMTALPVPADMGSETIRGGETQRRGDGNTNENVIFFGHHRKRRARWRGPAGF